jgi:hypothetical protein
MARRARHLLEPGFTYDDVNPNPPPVVGRVFNGPRPKTAENQRYNTYPSDDEEPSPVPSSGPRTREVMALIPSVRPRVPRPASFTVQTPEQQPAAPACPTAPQPNTRPTPENNPALALERLNLLQQYIIDQEQLKERYFTDLRSLNRRYGDAR